MSLTDQLKKVYQDYPVQPYVAADRDLASWLLTGKPVPKRNMEPLADDLLAGDIILLWRINFGTFTTESVFPKYFEYTYGINGPERLKKLVEEGYTYLESAFDSLDHINASIKKAILKSKGVAGLSKMKAADLDLALQNQLSEEELGTFFSVRGYQLTEKGQETLEKHQAVIDRHPKKSL